LKRKFVKKPSKKLFLLKFWLNLQENKKMALRCTIKVSSITNLSDARYAAGMGVEMLGFSVQEHQESYISAETYQEITSWISGADFVLEIAQCSLQELQGILEKYPCNALEIEDEHLLAMLIENAEFSENLPVKLLWKVKNKELFSQNAELWRKWIHYFVFSKTDINFCQEFAEKYPILLEGDFSAVEVEKILSETSFKGFSLKGSAEIAPGLKDFDHLAEVLEILETE
jgi:phosphoribosylanthranilate isomerase